VSIDYVLETDIFSFHDAPRNALMLFRVSGHLTCCWEQVRHAIVASQHEGLGGGGRRGSDREISHSVPEL
jgi:hypothetical protein